MINDSILDTIKKQLGAEPEYDTFDSELIPQINSTLMVLHQLNVGPAVPVLIEDSSTTWGDLVDDPVVAGFVETYVYLKTKLVFDPPTSATVLASLKESIAEFENRILYEADVQHTVEEVSQNELRN